MKFVKSLLLPTLLVLVLSGCTVTRQTVKQRQASFDGNAQDSGAKAIVATSRGNELEISPAARDRYNALVKKYGSREAVPVQPDAGLTVSTNGNWYANKDAQFRFAWFTYLEETPSTKRTPP